MDWNASHEFGKSSSYIKKVSKMNISRLGVWLIEGDSPLEAWSISEQTPSNQQTIFAIKIQMSHIQTLFNVKIFFFKSRDQLQL